eukprot:g94.t1
MSVLPVSLFFKRRFFYALKREVNASGCCSFREISCFSLDSCNCLGSIVRDQFRVPWTPVSLCQYTMCKDCQFHTGPEKVICMGVDTEETPLLRSPKLSSTRSQWKVWRSTSKYHRFFLLFFMCFIPFGAHFVKNCLSSLEQLMLDDPAFPINNIKYGVMVSAVTIPSIIIPFFGGLLMDKRGDSSILFFLVCTCVGQVGFTMAMQRHQFWLAILGRMLFGLGEGSVLVGTRVIVANFFDSDEIVFAMATTVAITSIAKVLAKSTVAPIAVAFGGIGYALWYSVFMCFISILVAVFVINCTRKLPKTKRQAHFRREDICSEFTHLSTVFWLLATMHVVFVNVFHPFQQVASSYLHQNYGFSIIKSGYVSSVSSGLTPGRGCARFHRRIPLSVAPPFWGVAFGCMEVMDSATASTANIVIGFLRDKTGSYDIDMYLLCSLAILSLFLTLKLYTIWFKREPTHWNQPVVAENTDDDLLLNVFTPASRRTSTSKPLQEIHDHSYPADSLLDDSDYEGIVTSDLCGSDFFLHSSCIDNEGRYCNHHDVRLPSLAADIQKPAQRYM